MNAPRSGCPTLAIALLIAEPNPEKRAGTEPMRVFVSGATTGQVIVFGKRISDRLTLGYEQGLSIAANALRLEYTLSNTLTLRAEAGTVSGVGVYYRRTYD